MMQLITITHHVFCLLCHEDRTVDVRQLRHSVKIYAMRMVINCFCTQKRQNFSMLVSEILSLSYHNLNHCFHLAPSVCGTNETTLQNSRPPNDKLCSLDPRSDLLQGHDNELCCSFSSDLRSGLPILELGDHVTRDHFFVVSRYRKFVTENGSDGTVSYANWFGVKIPGQDRYQPLGVLREHRKFRRVGRCAEGDNEVPEVVGAVAGV